MGVVFCAFKNIGDFRALCQIAVVDNLISKSTLIDELFEMVMALEEAFNVEIPSEDLEKIKTIKDVKDYIEKLQ